MARLTKRQMQCRKIAEEKARRRERARAMRRWVAVAALALCAGVAGGGWWLVKEDIPARMVSAFSVAFNRWTAGLGFTVEHVYLEGREHTPMEAVNNALGLKSGDSIFTLSVAEIRARLEKIDQVETARVERVLPDQLHLHISERVPVAVWQHRGEFYLIDRTGRVMSGWDIAQYRTLPVLTGEDAPGRAPALLSMLAAEPEGFKQVESAVRIGERRWNVRLQNGIEIKLPETGAESAWQRLWAMERSDHLFDKAITAIDLRLEDRMFLKLAPELMNPPAKPAKSARPPQET